MWKSRKLATITNLPLQTIQDSFEFLDEHRGEDLITVVSDCKEKFDLSDDHFAWIFASWYQQRKLIP